MPPFFIYLVQANIALALFYLLYAIVLKRDTFFRLRRFFFLSAIVFSLLYPFFAIPALSDLWTLPLSGLQEAGTTVTVGEPSLSMLVEEEAAGVPVISRKEILFLFYIVGTLLFVIRFLFQLFSVYRIRARSEKQLISGIPVYQLKGDISPFSFFNLIFIHNGKHTEAELSRILLHEQTHVRQRHSIDILLIESVSLFCWWNPFVWLMKREMATNLEYLADNGVLREGVDCREYQYHLLRLTYHETAVQIVNNFNVSQLKQRIMMMNKAKSPTLTLAKYFLSLPLFFLFVMANSIYASQNEDKSDVTRSEDERSLELSPQPRVVHDDLPEPPPEKKKEDNSEVYVVVEEQPLFPGGNKAMMKFLGDSVRYPVEAQTKGIQGRVVVNFIVEKDGSLGDFNIVRGVDPLLEKEALRVLTSMPAWTPGKQRGEVVRVRFTLPVVFRLTGPEPAEKGKKASQKKVEN